MPIYEYQCQACQATCEKLQKMSDSPAIDCEACGKPELERLISMPGFRLKGTGWYETDFKNSGKPAANKPTEARSNTDTPSSSSTDSNKSE